MKKRKVIKKSKKENFIYSNFKSGLIYIKKSWIFFVVVIILILLSALVGYFGVINTISPTLGKSIDNYTINSVQDIVKQTEGLNGYQLIGFIMTNNIKTAFLGMASGIFFAVSPIVVLIFNGYVLGFVAEKAVNSPLNTEGIFVLWRLLPHGIFEIPAILISLALGIKLGLYPFFVKEKGRGFLSLGFALLIFLALSAIIMIILLSFTGSFHVDMIKPNDNLSTLLNNPVISFFYFILIALSYIISIVIGLKVLSGRDRETVNGILVNSIRVFVFVVVPLLVIAGIIEGGLIVLLGG